MLPRDAQGSTLNLRRPGALQLTQAYTRYLRKREGLTELIAALRTAGYELEASLLDTQPAVEPWTGHRTHVGPTLPADAKPGDIWMDTVELVPMVLVPFEDTDEPILWLAMRPVARWQFAAFLKASRRSWGRRMHKIDPFDHRRLDGPELEPVTRVTHEEASIYAHWFGKLTASRVDWQLTKAFLPEAQFAALWGPVREWAAYDYDDEPGVIEPENVDLEDVLDNAPELLFGTLDPLEDVSFRTHVHLQIGIRTDTSRSELLRVKLRSLARR